ncbi:hypothetical protein FS837_010830 [Tulasnella sp. UAMH 9824]|nr:hypothetical protein FS837_010830 [Tulasnella sp. UAMH 9824]
MHYSCILVFLTSLTTVSADLIFNSEEVFEVSAINGRCTGANNAPGVCIATQDCTRAGGEFVSNRCPDDPENIKCCTKSNCGSGGSCKWTNQCSTSTVPNLCPGPADFKCCVPDGGGDGPFPTPKFPDPTSGCKAVAINGVKKIVAQFPGKVREIGCIRDCPCDSDPSSDHCCGKANDLMVSRAAGVKTEAGKPIAEWVMNNHGSLNVKYVMWGQRIWTWTVDGRTMPWSEWRWQNPKDRGSVTANHWDHVHVSYN